MPAAFSSLLIAALLLLTGAPRLSAADKALNDSAVLAAVCGGGDVRGIYNGYQVRMPDGRTAVWRKTYDGYTANIDGQSVRLGRTYSGFNVSGLDNSSRVTAMYNGFVVHGGRGGATSWSKTYNGYRSSGAGESVRLTTVYDGLRASRPSGSRR
jgi:hypothetical protein